MKLLIRACGILAFVGLIGAAILVVGMAGMLFTYGVNHETWWMFGLVLFGVVWFVLKRDQILKLVRIGLTGENQA